MVTGKSTSRIFHALVIVTILLTGVLPAQAESLAGPYTATVNTTGSGVIRQNAVSIPSNGAASNGENHTTRESNLVSNNVEAYIGGVLQGSYYLAPITNTRQSYAGVDSGPVKVMSTNNMPIVSSIREAWMVNGVTTSSFQLMGLPKEQLSDKYVFPGYNNVTLNEQMRIGNVDTVSSTVTVTIGGVLRGTYTLQPSAAVRVNYAGLDSGPVIVQGTSGVKIISSIREAWAVNGVTKSFVQLMGLPATQLSNKYVFPGYNNVTLNEQLRIGNVDTVPSTVTVKIGGVLRGTYTLQPSEAVRVNYAGLDSGPVVVEGTPNVKIISAIRDAWAVNGVTTSFSQLMGLPSGQLSNKYIFPVYDNVTLNDQLRIGNVDSVPTTVKVTIGGVLKGTYTLQPSEAVRVNYPGVDNGPVIVLGTPNVKIISSIREAWAANGVTTSFTQLMGLPAGQLSTSYMFPGYNNVTLSEQLRIASLMDMNPPATISNLTASAGATIGTVDLSWTAPGDDGSIGTATSYLVRYSASPISNLTAWDAATPVTIGVPTPKDAGQSEAMTVSGLTLGATYYFAIRAQDEVPNISNLSNSPSGTALVPIQVSDMPSLISAINQANSNGPGLDIIELANGAYSLMTAENGNNAFPIISSAIAIDGNQATLQRDSGALAFRFFNISSQGSLTLSDLTLRGGQSADNGGAIYNAGNLKLNLIVFIENTANDGGAIYSTANLTVKSGSFISNHGSQGGAIYSSGGILSIASTGISENTASYGGGIYTNSMTTITNTTIDNNNGGCCGGWGGGIYVIGGSVTISDSIISRNQGYFGSAINSSASVVLSKVQIINNSNLISDHGAIFNNAGTMSISDSVLGGNLEGALYKYDGFVTITNSCVTNNSPTDTGFVVTSRSTPDIIATHNWWGAPSGPSSTGTGTGDPIGPNIDFSSFETSPLASCPTSEAYISGIDTDPPSPSVPVNENLDISAKFYGTGGFSRNVQWAVLSGNGTISSTTGETITFTAPAATDITVIRLTSEADPTKTIDFKVLTAKIESISLDPHSPIRVLANGSVKAYAWVRSDSYSSEVHFPLVWSLTGAGSLGPSIRSGNGGSTSYYSALYHAPVMPNVPVFLRVSLKYFPNYYMDVPVQVVSEGPVSCANPTFPIFPDSSGGAHYSVSMGGIQANWPQVSEFNYDSPFDHIPNEIFSVNLRAYVKSTAIDPISNVNITFETDSSSFGPYPMTLDSGNGFDGFWKWQGSLPDSICENYISNVQLTNSVHTSLMGIAPRSR